MTDSPSPQQQSEDGLELMQFTLKLMDLKYYSTITNREEYFNFDPALLYQLFEFFKANRESYAQEQVKEAREEAIEMAIDTIEQFGYLLPDGRYSHGGLSTLEGAHGILVRYGVAKKFNKVKQSEITRYYANKRQAELKALDTNKQETK